MLLERDRRSGNIEIGNAENEGDCTLPFSFQSGPGFGADGGGAAAAAGLTSRQGDGERPGRRARKTRPDPGEVEEREPEAEQIGLSLWRVERLRGAVRGRWWQAA